MLQQNAGLKGHLSRCVLVVVACAMITAVYGLGNASPAHAEIGLRENVFVQLKLSNSKCLDIRNAWVIVQT